MKKFKVKLIWEEVYECKVEATNKTEAEAVAIEVMQNGGCEKVEEIYSDCKIEDI